MKELTREEARRRLRRVLLSWWDFYNADQFAALLEKSLEEERQAPPQEVNETALTIAAVVSYARPFSGNYDTPHTTGNFRKEHLQTALDESDLELHNRLMDLRNRDFAHSDAEVKDLSIAFRESPDGKTSIPVSRNAMQPLSKRDTRHLREVLSKLMRKADRERSHLEEHFDIGDEI